MSRPLFQRHHTCMFTHVKRRLATPTAKRYYAIRAPPPPPPKQTNTPSMPAMLAVASMGFAAYWQLVKSREGKTMPRRKDYTTVEEEANRQKRLAEVQAKRGKPLKPIPAFSSNDVTVVFLIGGPGSGKRTQCKKLAKENGFVHLSVGDLLRAEVQKGEASKYKEVVTEYVLNEGLTVPMEATIPLLEEAMRAAIAEGKPARFLVDGFPRKLDQAIKFEEVVVPARFAVHFECPENVMLQRSIPEGEGKEAAGAASNDAVEKFKRRFNIYKGSAEPVLSKFEKENKLKKILCDQPVEKIYAQIRSLLDQELSENKSV